MGDQLQGRTIRLQLPGSDRPWEVEIPAEKLLGVYEPRAHAVVEDVAAAVREAIQNPLKFPPLEQAIYPQDRVAIVVDGDPRNFVPVIAPLAEVALRRGVQPEDLCVVAPPRGDRRTAEVLPSRIRIEYHDPYDRQRLSYLASTEAGERIYLNRTVVDADVVLLVGAVRYDPILGYRGTSSAIFPALSTAEARERFVGSLTAHSIGHSTEWARNYVDEVGWLLGVQFAVQVVYGRHDALAGVFAGDVREVQRRAQILLDQVCLLKIPRRSELVIVTVERQGRQGLGDLGRCLEVASRAARKDGRVIVLSEVSGEPGPALEQARKAEHPREVLASLKTSTPRDAVTAYQLATACQHARVYLRSNLAPDVVEDLFMCPIDHPAQIQRLIQLVQDCVVIRQANSVRVALEG